MAERKSSWFVTNQNVHLTRPCHNYQNIYMTRPCHNYKNVYRTRPCTVAIMWMSCCGWKLMSPPKCTCWNLNNGVTVLGDFGRSWGQSPSKQDYLGLSASCFLPCEYTAMIHQRTVPIPYLKLSSLQKCDKTVFVLSPLPSLGYTVVTAQTMCKRCGSSETQEKISPCLLL